jgi:hypothetical protein
MGSAFRRYFLSPITPTSGAAFLDSGFAVAELRRSRGGGVSLSTSAVGQLPPDVLTASFDSTNILDPRELVSLIRQTTEVAGLGNKRRWSVALPEGVARSFVVGVESKPANRKELIEIIGWKVERAIAVPPSELRISHERLSPAPDEERYLVTVAHQTVLAEYESLFSLLKWDTGLILPRHLGEAQWLLWDRSAGDKLLVSSNLGGFTAVVVQNNELTLIRATACEPDTLLDELFRIARYYRDRLASGEQPGLSRALVLGGIDPDDALAVITDATGSRPDLIDPSDLGFELRGEPVRFDQLAGAAGLASLAWQ